MIYLYSRFPCVVYDNQKSIQLLPCVMKEIKNVENRVFLVYAENCFPVAVNFFEILHLNFQHPNIEKVEIENDIILFLNCNKICFPHHTQFKCGNLEFSLSVSNNILLTINGEKVMRQQIETELTYSHFEKFAEIVIIYLTGKRNYVIVVENKQVVFADFYDEINAEADTRYYMKKQLDFLNHGKVCKIEDKKAETYLVYLDDNELNMKNHFVFLVFLDCVIAKNYKYCNKLLSVDIRQKDENNIQNFFEEFDCYVPFKDCVITFKKNTLAGVYKFEIENNYVSNIIHL